MMYYSWMVDLKWLKAAAALPSALNLQEADLCLVEVGYKRSNLEKVVETKVDKIH